MYVLSAPTISSLQVGAVVDYPVHSGLSTVGACWICMRHSTIYDMLDPLPTTRYRPARPAARYPLGEVQLRIPSQSDLVHSRERSSTSFSLLLLQRMFFGSLSAASEFKERAKSTSQEVRQHHSLVTIIETERCLG